VWLPVGERPRAVVEPRYEWLYLYGFVEPKTAKSHWYLIPRVNTQWLNVVLKTLAAFEEATAEKIILLAGLKQNLSPNQAQTGFISGKYVHIFLQPAYKSIRYSCSKS